jgi:hypothetical protein
MLQKDVAELLGVDKTSVLNWKAIASAPEIRYIPAIIDFLWYDPLPQRRAGANGSSGSGPPWR